MKIFLIGFPGSGKTYLAEKSAELLKYPLKDTDRMIELEDGETIHEIFKKQGEALFREKEAEVLRTLSKNRQAIIATGGGLPCVKGNMEWMNENGFTIYLEASAAFLFHRLLKEKKTRPLISHLTDIELMIYITETLAGRRSYYEKANLTINAETCTPVKLSSAIGRKIKMS
ncbi:MAG: shikimate kinase [Bacteroidota bacterium]